MTQRSERPDGSYARDEDFVRGDGREAAAGARRPSGLVRLLRVLIFVLLLIIVVGGGLYLAIQNRLIDPAVFGLGGSGGTSTRPTAEAEVIFAGDAAAFAAAPGNTVQADPSNGAAWLRTSVKAASAEGATDGVSVVIPPALLPKLEGRRVRVTISARSGAEGTPIPFAAAYSAGPKGNSNWIVFVPEKTFTDHTFGFVVPIGEIGADDQAQRIAIWPDIEGRSSPLAVRSITIQPD